MNHAAGRYWWRIGDRLQAFYSASGIERPESALRASSWCDRIGVQLSDLYPKRRPWMLYPEGCDELRETAIHWMHAVNKDLMRQRVLLAREVIRHALDLALAEWARENAVGDA